MNKDREICDAASLEAPGRWTHTGALRVLGSRPCTCGECDENETVARVREIPVGAYIAHFDPERVAKLLGVVDAARKLGWGDTGPTRRRLREALIALDEHGDDPVRLVAEGLAALGFDARLEDFGDEPE
jgi:hypothetical protein